MSQLGEPLNLAQVSTDDDFHIDTSLAHDDGLFLPETTDDIHQSPIDALHNGLHNGLDASTPLDDAAVSAIKASLSQAQAQARLIDEEAKASASNSLSIDQNGAGADENNPVVSPAPHMAPFSKIERNDNTPHPEHMTFVDRNEFLGWLAGESSWCHFVQRRTTTPAKRAEERMKARVKAHEQALMEMSPEEAANAPPLKKRRRMRTSPVLEKITYTCHHAGSYASKHSDALPQNKLRLNTKTSVKCNCTARIVLTELQNGDCKVQYYWKHEGHDPFEAGELDSGRLPSVIDDWLIRQIHAGKDTDAIRKMLTISDEAKEQYVRKATEDPSSVDPDMPPPLAFQVKIKYPDIYNRFRKLKGPIRSIKVPKSRRNNANNAEKLKAENPLDIPNNDDHNAGYASLQDHSPGNLGLMDGMHIVSTEDSGVDHQFEVDDLNGHEMLAELANQHGHVDLAQALLRLPGANHNDEAAHLEAEVLKMAAMTGNGDEGGDADGADPATAWEAMSQLQ